MPSILWLFCFGFATLGHLALWIALFNRLHATNTPALLRKLSYFFVAGAIVAIPVLMVWNSDPFRVSNPFSAGNTVSKMGVYGFVCVCFGVLTFCIWTHRQVEERMGTTRLLSRKVENHDFRLKCQTRSTNDLPPTKVEQIFAAIPGNQIYQCQVEKRTLVLPGKHPDLNGLKIAHLSDLHLTGNVSRRFFEEAVELANQHQPDLVVLTGDILDSNRCWSWIPSLCGSMQARMGKFFVLGNHDRKSKDVPRLRRAMIDAGFQDAADRRIGLDASNAKISLAGNELPWFGRAREAILSDTEFPSDGLQILLTHSPDQWAWGRRLGFDLTLAGHCHGGQIRIPLIGPIVSPSLYGVKFSAGVFERSDKVLIVSRGLSSEEPIRLNCPPELGLITLLTESPQID